MLDLKISIALATFNGARFLKEQLASLAEQTSLPSELVVTDDGSTDETQAILESFACVAPFQVSFHRNDQRLGYGMNFLKAASLCSGDVIAFCDQDDVWLPAKLERLRKAFGHSQADFVAHAAEVTDSHLVRTGKRYPDIGVDRCLAAMKFVRSFIQVLRLRFLENFSVVLAASCRAPGSMLKRMMNYCVAWRLWAASDVNCRKAWCYTANMGPI